MIISPAILALLATGLLVSFACGAAGLVAIRVLRHWDLSSGSEQQIRLERQTYLASTFLTVIMAAECASLFLFVLTADQLHTQFTGAMCAAGTLYASPYGYPALLLKLLNSLLCGLWLIVNRADQAACDYPLIRIKYAALLGLTVLIPGETILLFSYSLSLRPDLITSCCGMLFSTGSGAPDLAAPPPGIGMIAFYVTAAALLVGGILLLCTGRGARVFGGLTLVYFLVSLVSIMSFISPYVYALPTHHCPFCLLQAEYHYVGYALYLCVLAGAIAGIGVGILGLLKPTASLRMVIPDMQRRLCVIALAATTSLLIITTVIIMVSPLRLYD